LKDYNIPVYKGNIVHFRDVFQQVIKNAFDFNFKEYLPNNALVATFRKKWRKPIKRKDIMIDMADEYMAGKMIYNK